VATVSTIGTSSRNYSTLQAWEDAVPATPTGGYEGHCYNDSQFTAALQIAGHTTSAANYIKLTAATGQSFQDHASVRTNALIYDQSKGVGISTTGIPSALDIDDPHVTVDRLQVRKTSTLYGAAVIDNASATAKNNTYKDLIIGKEFSGTNAVIAIRGGKLINSLVYDTGSTASTAAVSGAGGASLEMNMINCTVARANTAGGTGVSVPYADNLVNNSAVFGWTTAFGGAGNYNGSTGYNCTDAASAPGSNNQVSKTFSNQFVSTTADFRLKTGADCINTGNTDATNAPNDISGTVRGSTTTGDIGAWEFVASGLEQILTGVFGRLFQGKFG
jgi:hypothetical protein